MEQFFYREGTLAAAFFPWPITFCLLFVYYAIHRIKLTSCRRAAATICPRPLYAGRCGPAAAHPLRLRRPARLASNSCGRHEY